MVDEQDHENAHHHLAASYFEAESSRSGRSFSRLGWFLLVSGLHEHEGVGGQEAVGQHHHLLLQLGHAKQPQKP